MSSKNVTNVPNEGFTVGMDAAAGVAITVLIVIDTDYVKAHFPNPSMDPAKPTKIDEKCEFMICTGSRGILGGQGTPNLSFQADADDSLSFSGQSIYGNSNDAVIVYAITQLGDGVKVFNNFTPTHVKRSGAAIPDTSTLNGLPAKHIPIDFMSLRTTLSETGKTYYTVSFAIYELREATRNQTQELVGYYYWDPYIVVQ
jgi:nematocidal protein AidA